MNLKARASASACALLAVVALAACTSVIAGRGEAQSMPASQSAPSVAQPANTDSSTPTSAAPSRTSAPRPSTTTTTTAMTPHASPNPRPGPPIVNLELLGDVNTAIDATNATWRDNWPGWHRPAVWNGNGLYDAVGRDAWSDPWRVGPECRGEPAAAFNAQYCAATDTLAWDLTLLESYRKRIGHRFISVVVAHEFGHAVQQRLTASGQGHLVWSRKELQADCLAGALLVSANNAGRITVSPGEEDQMFQSLAAVADSEPWYQAGDHGDASERVGSFQTGVGLGVEGCIGPKGPVEISPASSPLPGLIQQSTLLTPSGNIACVAEGSTLTCVIREHDFPSNPCPYGDSGSMVTLNPTGFSRIGSCAGEILQPVLTQYGTFIDMGNFVCNVEKTGVWCINLEGHGFNLARAGYFPF